MQKIGQWVSYILLSLFACISLLPLIWMISTAFKMPIQTFTFPPEWMPSPIVFDNFGNVLKQLPLIRYLMNTLFITVVLIAGQLIFGSMAAYGFSRIQFPGRDACFVLFLTSMMIPQVVTMIPQYIILRELGWLDSFKAIIAPHIFGVAVGVFLLRQFMLSLPKDLEAAAEIDGAGTVRTFTTIILPLCRPAIATVGVLTFTRGWNEFLWPLIVINSRDKHMISVGLSLLTGEFTSDWSSIMAGAVVALLPILIIFIIAQRYFIESIYMSGIKG